jgi:hypothetical protein
MRKTKKMLEQEFVARMDALTDGDIEETHISADDLLCELLEQLGFKSVVDSYNRIYKWYA